MTGSARWISAAGAVLGLTGVALAAAGSHALSDAVAPAGRRAWDAAVLTQLVHAVALLAVGVSAEKIPLLGRLGALTMLAGTVVFSGSVYLRIGIGVTFAWGIAPVGGLMLMLAWLLLLISFLRH